MYIIQTYTLPATTFRGTRIKAVSNTGRKIIVSYDHSAYDAHESAARALADRMGHSTGLLTKVPYEGRKGALFALETV